MLKKLNLGCGTDIMGDAINIDIYPFEGVNIEWDLNKIPYPYEDNSIDKIIMNDILEHLDKPVDVLRECHRILKSEGILIIKVVYWNHKYSFSDFTHLHAFSEISFNCLIGKGRPLEADFKFSKMQIEYIFDIEAIKKYGADQALLLKKAYFHTNIIQGMIINLKK